MKKDQRGFSMVELVVVIAIIGVLVGASVSLLGYLRYANNQKAVETVSDMLNRMRITSMSRQGPQYLYIYRLSDGYYMKLTDVLLDTYDDAALGSDGTKICSSGIAISMNMTGGTPTDLQIQNQVIRIVYKRNGVLNDNTAAGGSNADQIIFTSNTTYTIRIYTSTGKHAILQ